MQSVTTSSMPSFPHIPPSDVAIYRKLMLDCCDDWRFCDSYPSYCASGMDVRIFPGHPAERQVHFDYNAAEYVRMLDLLELTERADRMRTNRPGRLFRWFCRIERQYRRPELNLPVCRRGYQMVIGGLVLAICCSVAISLARFTGLQLLFWVKNVLECCSYAVFAIVYFGLAAYTVATWQEWRSWPTEVWPKIYLAYRARLAYMIGIACISDILSTLTLCDNGCLDMPRWVIVVLTLFLIASCVPTLIYSVVSLRAMEYNVQEPLRLQERMLKSSHSSCGRLDFAEYQ